MKHKYPEKEIEVGEQVILVYNKIASGGRNGSPSKFIKIVELVKKYLKAKIVVIPDESMDIEPDPSIPILIYGGDGTIHRVITAITGRYRDNIRGNITVGHLRGGTMNTIATCLRISNTKNLIKTLYMSNKVRVTPRRAIEVYTESDHLCGFIFGAILPHRFLERYYAGVVLGPIGGFKTLITVALQGIKNQSDIAKKERAKIKVDEVSVESDFLIIGAGTVHSFGLNFSNFPLAPLTQDSFNLIAYAEAHKKLVAYLPLIYFGKLPKSAINILTKKAEIEFEKEVGFTVDGDLYKSKKIKLAIGPEINFII